MDLVFDVVDAETQRPVENPFKKIFCDGKVAGLADLRVFRNRSTLHC